MHRRADDTRSSIVGTVRRRLLVNAVVDPHEAAARLPAGVAPHVSDQGTVVGCCLLELEAIRPAFMPAVAGRTMRAAAHRISAEWVDRTGATVTGVYVPARHTDERLAAALGGRWFPGVHRRARVEVSATESRLRWSSDPLDGTCLGVRVVATAGAGAGAGARAVAACDPVGTTCLGASVGVSPDHRGRLEAARMDLSHRDVYEVVVEDLASGFVDSFASAEPSTSYLMCDAEVTWTRAAEPSTRLGVAP
jgi:hypothetical protein